LSTPFADDVVTYLPHLRAFARLLSQNRTMADDLVQETVVRALSHAHQFHPGTNLKAWLTTILRNAYFSDWRNQKRVVHPEGDVLESAMVAAGQEWRLHMRDLASALSTLPTEQREAVVLVGASGFSYDEAAKIARCATGTMKSRVSRARAQLHGLVDGRAGLASRHPRPRPRASPQP
jgi:RNA polymerase sigma-70 factor (ECF subfamily)